MQRLSLAIAAVALSAPALGQALPPSGTPVPRPPVTATNPSTMVPPIVPVRARNAKRQASPGFSGGVPIIDGNPHIRINGVGQVLTDELP